MHVYSCDDATSLLENTLFPKQSKVIFYSYVIDFGVKICIQKKLASLGMIDVWLMKAL